MKLVNADRRIFELLSACMPIAAFLVVAVLSAGYAIADEANETAPAAPSPDAQADVKPTPPDADQIRQWIADLESASQATRGAAQLSLQRAGDVAVAQVSAAARSANPEVRVRAVEILRRHALSDNLRLLEAGQTALDDLAKDGDMGIARAAESALAANARQRAAEELEAQQEQLMARRLVRGRPLIKVDAMKIMAMPGVRSLSVTVINGKRTIHAESDDETVEISDGGDEGISMSISRKGDGKVKKEEFKAKDAAELKAKHAEAFKVYQRYADQGGGAVIRAEVRAARAIEFKKAVKPEKLPREKAAAEAVEPKQPPVNHTDVPRVVPMPTPQR